MSHHTVPAYLLYRTIIKSLLRVVGLWPEENPKIFYRLLPYSFLFANICVTLGILFYIKMHSVNFTSAMKGLSMIPSFMTVNLKIICIMIHREDANELHNLLDLHYSKLVNNQQVSTIVLTDFRSFRRLSLFFTFSAIIIISIIVMTPIISLIYQHLHAVNPIIYPLVYPTQYPWSFDPPGFRYQIHFLIEYAAVVPHLCVSHLDTLFMMYGFQMIGQFREMGYRITHIDDMTEGSNAVKECVRQHQLLLRSRDILQKIFGPILLWVWTANAISLCSFIFQLTQMKSISISTLMTSAGYVVFKLLQTFVYAYTGTCLTTESEHYQQAIYNANWQTNRRFMTSILIMLSQEPLILTACSFSVISLNLFIKFLNTTVSYFFLLQAVS